MTYAICIIGALVLASFVIPRFNERRKDRLIRSVIGFDRFCRLADISEKDLRYTIVGEHRIHGVFGSTGWVQFYVLEFAYCCAQCHAQAPSGNGCYIVSRKVEVCVKSNGSVLEDDIAQGILRIKNGVAEDGKWLYS